jgi:hypothetical protein
VLSQFEKVWRLLEHCQLNVPQAAATAVSGACVAVADSSWLFFQLTTASFHFKNSSSLSLFGYASMCFHRVAAMQFLAWRLIVEQ